jgi:hypothetical protein
VFARVSSEVAWDDCSCYVRVYKLVAQRSLCNRWSAICILVRYVIFDARMEGVQR